MARCLITGCELIDPDQGRWVHGDLHTEGNCYVFNAVLGEKGEAAWQYDEAPGEGDRTLTIHIGADIFERRGVIVVSEMGAELNETALRYIRD